MSCAARVRKSSELNSGFCPQSSQWKRLQRAACTAYLCELLFQFWHGVRIQNSPQTILYQVTFCPSLQNSTISLGPYVFVILGRWSSIPVIMNRQKITRSPPSRAGGFIASDHSENGKQTTKHVNVYSGVQVWPDNIKLVFLLGYHKDQRRALL